MEIYINFLEKIREIDSKSGIENVFAVVGSIGETMALILAENTFRVKKRTGYPQGSVWFNLTQFTYTPEEVKDFMLKTADLLQITPNRNHTIKFNDCMIYYMPHKNTLELYNTIK